MYDVFIFIWTLFSRIFLPTIPIKVMDYNLQQCRSTVVRISSKPELRLEPPSATIYRGDSMRIRCLSDDIEQTNGYSWTKNDALFQSNADTELWEDLYPDGSILRINNIQVIYTIHGYIQIIVPAMLSILRIVLYASIKYVHATEQCSGVYLFECLNFGCLYNDSLHK